MRSGTAKSLMWAAACIACGAAVSQEAPAAVFRDPLDVPASIGTAGLTARIFAVAEAGGDTAGRLFAVGAQGTILASDDGGGRWEPVPAPVSADLTAVTFPSAMDGFIVGHDSVLLRSRDGGRSWSRQFDVRSLNQAMLDHYRSLPVAAAGSGDAGTVAQWIQELEQRVASGAPLPFFDVWFSDARQGFAVGAFNLLLVTEDGGEHWTPWMERTENPRGAHLYAVRGTPGPRGEVYIAGELGLLMRLDREKRRFVAVPTPYEGTYFSMAVEGDMLVVAGLRGNAFISRDRGQGWTRLDTGSAASIASVAALGRGRFALLTQNGSVLPVDRDGRTGPATALGRLSYTLAATGDGAVAVGTDSGMRRVVLPAAAR